jgi:hypothetical protein
MASFHRLVSCPKTIAQPRQTAQLATISGNIGGVENHHCI